MKEQETKIKSDSGKESKHKVQTENGFEQELRVRLENTTVNLAESVVDSGVDNTAESLTESTSESRATSIVESEIESNVQKQTVCCNLCGDIDECGEFVEFQEQFYCPACLGKVSGLCEHCGKRVSKDSLFEFEGKLYCPTCLNKVATICDHCGKLCEIDSLIEFQGHLYCVDCFEHVSGVCEHCGKRFDLESLNEYDCKIYCDDCLEKVTAVCSHCGQRFRRELVTEFDGKLYCHRCLSNETVICSHCGERIYNYDNNGSDSLPLCIDCYDNHYTTCCHCDAVIHHDDAYYEDAYSSEAYCYDCYNRYVSSSSIRDYYYKPKPIFYGASKRYFGVELEVDDGGEYDENAESVLNIGNNGGVERIYCKHDGSLDDGFEIVTHPMTLEYHLNEMPWKSILSDIRSMGYLSHRAGSCGLHIHVNRNSLGSNTDEQDACIARILYFFEKHWEELLKFSRRTQGQLDRWAARYGYKDQPMDILDNAKKGTSAGRYTCINLLNYATIEFRMFRGTLKHNTIIATLQLVNRVCEVAIALSDKEIKGLSWTSFVASCTEPELIQYLKERQLYINEPVTCEEED